jgi:DNA-binding SARP family transcriptional activator
MSQLHIHLFGAPQVIRDNAVITISRRKTFALLAYLAVTAQPQQRDSLAAMFWPEYGEATASHPVGTQEGNARRI